MIDLVLVAAVERDQFGRFNARVLNANNFLLHTTHRFATVDEVKTACKAWAEEYFLFRRYQIVFIDEETEEEI